MSLAGILFRHNAGKSDRKRDAGLSTPAQIERFDDICYGPRREHTMDLYRPRERSGPLPVIVSIHGGGYVYGSTKIYQFYCMDLARRGFAVLNFNYRLAPRHKFPAPLEDTNLVLNWLVEHAAGFGLDLDRVCMIGDSAGAQLLSQYAVMVTNPVYADVMGIHPPEGFRLRAIGLNCGVYELPETIEGMPGGLMRDYLGRDPKRFGARLRPLDYLDGRYPPSFLISAPGDFLYANQQPMCDLIRSRGGEAEFHSYGDESVGHVFFCDIRNPLSCQANDEECAFFQAHIL